MPNNSSALAKDTIHLAAAFDQNFLTPFYVLLASIFDSNKTTAFHLHIIATGISKNEKKSIATYIQDNESAITFYNLTSDHLAMIVMPDTDPRYTVANFYRIFFPLLVPKEVRRLIYLDTDIVVTGCFEGLYNADLQHHAFGAVIDPIANLREDLGITEPGKYFNSGVLLIDLAKWNEKTISEQALAFLHANPEKCVFVDQDALNAVAIGEWQPIDPRYNLMGQYVPKLLRKQYPSYLQDKVVVHFNLLKPWNRLCRMRLKFLYFHYHQLSPQKGGRPYQPFTFSPINIARLLRNKIADLFMDHLQVTKNSI